MCADSAADEPYHDVIVCGGGLAGLTLARQLKLALPNLDVLVLEKVPSPLPEACVKVGESTVEIAAAYLTHELKLGDYLKRRQLPKFGLRFFLGDGRRPFHQRVEVGLSIFPPLPTLQLDRGRLENDLRDLAVEMGVKLVDAVAVEDILLAEDDGPHRVRVQPDAGAARTLRCRWVVDALGRRRLLQTKLKLSMRDNGHRASAAWFRMAGCIKIEDLVSPRETSWHRRTVGSRWYSTNHLMGEGYWVWAIPLSSGSTSFGIVTDEDRHPLRTYGLNYEQALGWLAEHEPALAQLLAHREPLDFKRLRNFSYHSRQVFSERRWSCVGEAGAFLDPFYSPGSDYIAIGNTITVELIRRDLRGELTRELADLYNELELRTLYDTALEIYRGSYGSFGNPRVFTAKHLWDNALYWAGPVQLYLQDVLRQPETVRQFIAIWQRVKELQIRVQELFRAWAAQSRNEAQFQYFDISLMPFLQFLVVDLLTKKSAQEFLSDLRQNLDRLEEAAQVLFFNALADTMPEALSSFPEPRWVNAWSISLDRASWEADGLFAPLSLPRDLRTMEQALFGGLLVRRSPANWLRAGVFRLAMRLGGGRALRLFIRLMVRASAAGRRSLVRRLFIKDRLPEHVPAAAAA